MTDSGEHGDLSSIYIKFGEFSGYLRKCQLSRQSFLHGVIQLSGYGLLTVRYIRLVRRSTEVKRIQPRHFSLKGSFRDLRVVLQTHHIDVATLEPLSHISPETIEQRWRLPPKTPKKPERDFLKFVSCRNSNPHSILHRQTFFQRRGGGAGEEKKKLKQSQRSAGRRREMYV